MEKHLNWNRVTNPRNKGDLTAREWKDIWHKYTDEYHHPVVEWMKMLKHKTTTDTAGIRTKSFTSSSMFIVWIFLSSHFMWFKMIIQTYPICAGHKPKNERGWALWTWTTPHWRQTSSTSQTTYPNIQCSAHWHLEGKTRKWGWRLHYHHAMLDCVLAHISS
jgi:hypothetical protein